LIFSSSINLDKLIFGSSLSSVSPAGRVDPRVKLLATLFLAASISVILDAPVYLLISLLLMAGIFLARIPLRLVAVNFRPFILLAAITFLLHLLFSSHGGAEIISIRGLEITDKGLIAGGMFAWRIFLFFALVTLFNLTTDPIDISDALVRLMGPLKRLKIPVDHLGLVVFMAFRFIPLLFEEARMIYAAQLSRGFNPKGGLVKRAKNAVPLMTAVFMASIRRADNMALALEARGFYPGRERSSYRLFKIKPLDIIILAITFVVLILAVWYA
jgi:energy-coupling factor transport system permease protein